MKLSKRLKKIESMVSNKYTHIWDCCCDHGLLGTALLSRQAAPMIHFVDRVPKLIYQLQDKLQRFYACSDSESESKWQTHCLDVGCLALDKNSLNNTDKHLIIIAGVGGDLMTQLVKSIRQGNQVSQIDFLLCPVHHQFTLRQQLIELNGRLIDEVLIEENQRFYEILLVSVMLDTDDRLSNISPVGDLIWQADTPTQKTVIANYLQKKLSHLHKIQLSNSVTNSANNIQPMIDAYQSITL